MIVFRWLAQVGGASSCMCLTETTLAAALKTLEQLQYNNYTHCVPAVFLVLLISFKGGVPPRPPKKNSCLLTQKLLAASNGELYIAM